MKDRIVLGIDYGKSCKNCVLVKGAEIDASLALGHKALYLPLVPDSLMIRDLFVG